MASWFAIGLVVAATVSGSFVQADESTKSPETTRPHFYWFFNLGPYEVKEDLGLLGSASDGLQLAGGFGHHMSRHFAGELELGVLGRDHEVPSWLSPDTGDMTLAILWFSYSIAARFPVGKFEPFVAVGVGSGQANLNIVADDPLETPMLEVDEDRGILFHYRVGFDAAVGKKKKHRVGMEVRRMVFEADLGVFTGGKTDIGGTGVLFTYRYMI